MLGAIAGFLSNHVLSLWMWLMVQSAKRETVAGLRDADRLMLNRVLDAWNEHTRNLKEYLDSKGF